MRPDGDVHDPRLMDRLVDFILSNEETLMEHVLAFAKVSGYAKYASTLFEAWRTSIAGLSGAFKEAIETHGRVPPIHAEEDIVNDPMTSFAVMEAQRHRERGVRIDMFLGLLKYYRRAYVELIHDIDEEPAAIQLCLDSIHCFFDKIEIAFCSEWAELDKDRLVEELQASNRFLSNEKNKYLTIFESLNLPVFLIEKDLCIENLNYSASVLLKGQSVPGGRYYTPARDPYIEFVRKEWKVTSQEQCPAMISVETVLPWLAEDLKRFSESEDGTNIIEKEIEILKRTYYYEVALSKMLDISRKFEGVVVILNDITHKKKAEQERIEIERLKSAVETAGAACHEINQPLQIVMGLVEMMLESINRNHASYANVEEVYEQISNMKRIMDKLKNITKYKTRSYVGSKVILDIDAASTSRREPR